MKGFWLTLGIIVIIAAAGIGGYYGYQYWTTRNTFLWGVTIRPHAIGNFTASLWKKQLNLAGDLKVNAARITWQYDAWYKGKEDPFGFQDNLLVTLKEKGAQVLLVIEPQPNKEIPDYYQEGYNNGYDIAKHYKGKIRYYQLMNEGGAQTIKSPTNNGQDPAVYDAAKYEIVKNYMRGLSDGISKADSNAIKIITISWTHTGFLDKITQDGIKFDWIGLDWYHWMGTIQDEKMADGQLFLDKLKSFKKPLIFIEVNNWPKKNQVDEAGQTDFITKTATWAWENKDLVKGFFVFELVDNINGGNDNGEFFGLVSATKKSKAKFVLGDPRPAYQAYQNLIKQYSK